MYYYFKKIQISEKNKKNTFYHTLIINIITVINI